LYGMEVTRGRGVTIRMPTKVIIRRIIAWAVLHSYLRA
jgi:hypothetical protein